MEEVKTPDIPESKAEDVKASGGITTKSDEADPRPDYRRPCGGHYAASDQSKTTKYEQCIPPWCGGGKRRNRRAVTALNHPAGMWRPGLAIAELIAGMTKPPSPCVGRGHSIGVPLAVSTKKSFIACLLPLVTHP